MGVIIGVLDLAELDAEGEFEAEEADEFREDIAILNRFLLAEGFAPFVEPRPLPEFRRRSSGHHSFAALQELRRAYVCLLAGEELRTGEVSDEDLEFIRRVRESHPESHLLHHSEYEGYYIAREMPKGPLIDNDLPGVYLGSSQGLMKELLMVGEALGFEVIDGRLSRDCLKELKEKGRANPQYESVGIWLSLFESARFSVKYNTLVSFT